MAIPTVVAHTFKASIFGFLSAHLPTGPGATLLGVLAHHPAGVAVLQPPDEIINLDAAVALRHKSTASSAATRIAT